MGNQQVADAFDGVAHGVEVELDGARALYWVLPWNERYLELADMMEAHRNDEVGFCLISFLRSRRVLLRFCESRNPSHLRSGNQPRCLCHLRSEHW